jgi:DNA-binding response OmpR family regulator
MMHVLIVEDHAALARNLAEALERLGHTADFASDGEGGLRLALELDFDVIILDLSLPRMDGLEMCRRLREAHPRRVPVLMLTARDTLRHKLDGFANGADDYLVKPFAMEELLARCLALVVRHQDFVLTVGSLAIDRRRRSATRSGQPLALSPLGFRLLCALAEAHPRMLTRSELCMRVWGDEPPDSDSLRSHLYQLRQVLDKPFAQPMLVTVHGIGMRLEAGA